MKGIVLGILVIVFALASAIHVEVVLERNTTGGDVIEDVTFDDGTTKSKKQVKVVDLKLTSRNPSQKTDKQPTSRPRHHRNHRRRRCCEAGDLAAKHGLSCNLSRDYPFFFFNLTTRTRQKYQGQDKFVMRRMRHIYKRMKKCVRYQMKKAVQKCCVAYVTRSRSWRRG